MSLVDYLEKVSLLSDRDIIKLIEDGELRIEPYDKDLINPASIDLQLGSILVKYSAQTIKIGTDKPQSHEIDISNISYVLKPEEFILGTTKEKVYIPDGYLGVIETRGNIARAGIQIYSGIQSQINDGHIDPGFYGHITLEIRNLNQDVNIELIPDIRICQLFIGKLSSKNLSLYRGKYLEQVKPTTYLP